MITTRITGEQLERLRAALAAGATKNEACQAAGIRRVDLDADMRPGGPLAELRIGRRYRPPTPDPTPLEIRARAAAIRAAWPDERWTACLELEDGP